MITTKRLDYPFGIFLTVPSRSNTMVQDFSMIDFEEFRNMCSFLQILCWLSFDCSYILIIFCLYRSKSIFCVARKAFVIFSPEKFTILDHVSYGSMHVSELSL